MTYRNKKYTPRGTSVPMLVNRAINETVETLDEHMMLNAFVHGFATRQHFDYIVRMSNMLNIAAQTKKLDKLAEGVEQLNVIAGGILGRYKRTNKFGVSGEDLKTLRKLVAFYDQFWKRQTTTFYNECVAELNAYYSDLQDKRAA